MMKYVVAVSGGVDSVVLLDMLVRQYGAEQLVVAHFEHGIRGEASRADARFVEFLSQKYRLKFEISHGNLTKNTSEALARQKRYDFLKAVAKKHQATLVTAHHQDDLVETIAINLMRGTGWRGLAVFGDATIERPLLKHSKTELYDYALKHRLEWVEDETNKSDRYLRNRLRKRLRHAERAKILPRIYDLWQRQSEQKSIIDKAIRETMTISPYSRYFFTMVPEMVALELLRHLTQARLTRPQLARMLLAIKTAQPHTQHTCGGGVCVRFSQTEFFVKASDKLL